MATSTWTDRVGAIKDRSPRRLKTLADVTTRRYAMVTAGWRDYPDFLIMGTKRGGTTSLWNYLVGHPQVAPMVPGARGLKSNAYFFENLHRGPRWYRSHFLTRGARRWRAVRGGTVVTGEASPYYMYGPHIPSRVAELMPYVRAIVLLRDPVDRAYGHYQERAQQGVEPLSFGEALDAEDDRLAGEWERMLADPTYYSRAHDFYSYRDRGVYLPQLRRVLAALPADQVFIARSEDLYEDAQRAFDATCAFLGIERCAIAAPKRHNYIARSEMPTEIAQRLTSFYAPHNEALYQFVGRDFGWRR